MDNTVSDKYSIGYAKQSTNDGMWFGLTMLYLIIEYGRPMDAIPGLGAIKPGMIVSILLMLSWFLRGTIREAWSKQTIYILLFILLLTVYIPFARNNYYAYKQTIGILLYIPFFLSAIIYINSFQRLKIFMNIWITLMIYLSLKGIAGKGIGGSSFLNDENDFSLLMNMMLPFGYFLFMYEKAIAKKIVYLSASILAIVSIVTSSSRGGFIGLLAVSIVMWHFSPKKIISLLLVVILVGIVSYSADRQYWNRISTIGKTDEGTAKERLDSWKAGWEMFKDNPLGVGGGNFPVRFPEYQSESIQRGMWGRAAHSLWITLIAELGILGTIIYFILINQNMRDIRWLKKLKNSHEADKQYVYYLSLAFIAAFAGFFSSGSFLSVLYYPHYWYITALIVATRRLSTRELQSNSTFVFAGTPVASR